MYLDFNISYSSYLSQIFMGILFLFTTLNLILKKIIFVPGKAGVFRHPRPKSVPQVLPGRPITIPRMEDLVLPRPIGPLIPFEQPTPPYKNPEEDLDKNNRFLVSPECFNSQSCSGVNFQYCDNCINLALKETELNQPALFTNAKVVYQLHEESSSPLKLYSKPDEILEDEQDLEANATTPPDKPTVNTSPGRDDIGTILNGVEIAEAEARFKGLKGLWPEELIEEKPNSVGVFYPVYVPGIKRDIEYEDIDRAPSIWEEEDYIAYIKEIESIDEDLPVIDLFKIKWTIPIDVIYLPFDALPVDKLDPGSIYGWEFLQFLKRHHKFPPKNCPDLDWKIRSLAEKHYWGSKIYTKDVEINKLIEAERKASLQFRAEQLLKEIFAPVLQILSIPVLILGILIDTVYSLFSTKSVPIKNLEFSFNLAVFVCLQANSLEYYATMMLIWFSIYAHLLSYTLHLFIWFCGFILNYSFLNQYWNKKKFLQWVKSKKPKWIEIERYFSDVKFSRPVMFSYPEIITIRIHSKRFFGFLNFWVVFDYRLFWPSPGKSPIKFMKTQSFRWGYAIWRAVLLVSAVIYFQFFETILDGIFTGYTFAIEIFKVFRKYRWFLIMFWIKNLQWEQWYCLFDCGYNLFFHIKHIPEWLNPRSLWHMRYIAFEYFWANYFDIQWKALKKIHKRKFLVPFLKWRNKLQKFSFKYTAYSVRIYFRILKFLRYRIGKRQNKK